MSSKISEKRIAHRIYEVIDNEEIEFDFATKLKKLNISSWRIMKIGNRVLKKLK